MAQESNHWPGESEARVMQRVQHAELVTSISACDLAATMRFLKRNELPNPQRTLQQDIGSAADELLVPTHGLSYQHPSTRSRAEVRKTHTQARSQGSAFGL
jgi:hypothetical protein